MRTHLLYILKNRKETDRQERDFLRSLCSEEECVSLLQGSFSCLFSPTLGSYRALSGSSRLVCPLWLSEVGCTVASVCHWSSRWVPFGLSDALSSIMTLSVSLLKARHTGFKRGLPWSRFVQQKKKPLLLSLYNLANSLILPTFNISNL